MKSLSGAASSQKSLNSPALLQQGGPYGWVLGVGLFFVLVAAALDALFGHPINPTTAAAATGVLAVASGAALAIERALELFWNLVDQLATNPSTPFDGPAKRLAKFATQLGEMVKPAIDEAKRIVDAADTKALTAGADFNDLKGRVENLDGQLQAIVGGGDPGPVIESLKDGLDQLKSKLADPHARASVVAAAAVVQSADELIGRLANDPGRTVMSLLGGATIGILVAGVLGLDVIHAALAAPPPPVNTFLTSSDLGSWLRQGPSAWNLGLIASGLAIGLGSNPLHELVKAIQDYKQSTRHT